MKHYFQIPIFPILFILAFFTSCNGQSKTNLPKNSEDKARTETNGLPKIRKNPDIKKTANVHSGLQDKSGKIWFGTNNCVFCYNGNSFTHFLQNDGVINKSNLNLKSTTTILQDRNGNMWFTTWFEGVCRFDGKSITSFKPNNEVWFSSLMEDKNGDIWVGRRLKGITRFDGKTFTNLVQHGILDSCGADAFTVD